MSTKDFIVPTTTIYRFVNFMWVAVCFVSFILCIVALIDPYSMLATNISYDIKNAGHIIGMEDQRISMVIGDAMIEYPEDYKPPLVIVSVKYLTLLLEIILTLFILYLVRQIIKEAIHQNPLNYKNSHRLLLIGWAIIGYGLNEFFVNIFDYATADYVLSECFANDASDIENPSNRTSSTIIIFSRLLTSTNMLTGLLVIALSTVFKKGALMKEEADLTI